MKGFPNNYTSKMLMPFIETLLDEIKSEAREIYGSDYERKSKLKEVAGHL